MLGPDDDCALWLAGSSSISAVLKFVKMKDIRRTNRDRSLEISLLSSLFHYLKVKSNATLNLVAPVDPKLVNNDMPYEKLKVNHCIQM